MLVRRHRQCQIALVAAMIAYVTGKCGAVEHLFQQREQRAVPGRDGAPVDADDFVAGLEAGGRA